MTASELKRHSMATKQILSVDQETLADALFPQEPQEDLEEAILAIPPERRVLRTEHYDFSVATILSMMQGDTVTIPEFQRRYVWTDRQASRLVESLIIQCPIPVIYMNQERDETFSVIDGNQRLISLRRFMEGKFSLSGLTSYPELSGLKYSQLDPRFQRHISNRVLRCTVILKETHPQVKFDVFERLNTGAVALTRQEIRHGLYFGPLMEAAAKIATNLKLERHFSARKDKRMKAEELVLRYWALNQGVASYEKPLATFISNFAETNRNMGAASLNELIEDFGRSHERTTMLFGPYAFKFMKGNSAKFNAAVFDAQMIACGRLKPSRFELLTLRKAAVRVQYEELQREPEFARSVTLATSDKSALQGRIHKLTTLLKDV